MKTETHTITFNNPPLPDGFDVLIISGVHGNELTPIIACTDLFNEIKDLDKFNNKINKITFLFNINISGIRNNIRDMVSPNNDLNRRLSIDISPIEKIKNLIDQHNVIIDVHSSPNILECVLINIDSNTYKSFNLIKNLDIPMIFRYSESDTIKKYVLDQDKLCFTLELNGINKIDYNSAEVGHYYLHKLLMCLDLDVMNKIKIEEKFFKPVRTIYSIKEGIWECYHKIGYFIKESEILGSIVSYPTKSKVNIVSPISGIYMCGLENGSFTKEENLITYIQPYI